MIRLINGNRSILIFPLICYITRPMYYFYFGSHFFNYITLKIVTINFKLNAL
jgi:hypothetical protein